ncbi:acetolactate synthase large subunit [Hyphomicrobium facile]|uniref:Acetolactate synthase-1/2/3 large subunit n=1 Tax=Hyphomicrobium facile TaxID=51670 RepID=A0A1I7NC79_9HYPH|nr:acetolactate synthase large subunit [Hyphomicrobium facile]SFV32259.1 acetolactate synthase-1/2/3 large subunit [Hyphomicrobium facile]
MNGAQALITTALNEGIEVCFANPGTTELPLVLAMDQVAGMRGILCLHENVATGAADGYGRMLTKPAMCLLHLGPGLANGLTNLHNARRAGTPILNVIGEHATWHRAADPLLASDIEGLAHTVSAYTKRNVDAAGIASDLAEAVERARAEGIATLIVPHDCQLGDAGDDRPHQRAISKNSYSPANVTAATRALKRGKSAILLGGEGLSETGMRLAGRIAAAAGADLLCDTFFARMERGGDLPAATRLPYFPDHALALTRRYENVVLAGTRRPVAFFGYHEQPSYLTSEEQTVTLAARGEDVLGALEAVAAELQASQDVRRQPGKPISMPRGGLDAQSVTAIIGLLQPENCIVMDEALTAGTPYFEASRNAPRFSHLMLTGGAIGQGPGTATGAAIACPDRKVINFESDGCGAYSVQAFWTQARENLDVVTIIGSNRSYNILNVEFERAGVTAPGPVARSMTGLDRPNLNWVKIGAGFGVPSVAVDSAEALVRELEKALAEKGPRLIEAIMS